VAAKIGVEVTEGGDRAPAPGEVGEVKVGRADGALAKIECAGSKDAADEVPSEGEVPAGEEGHLRLVEHEEDGGSRGEKD
jgi:hypothetical protein